MLLCAAGPARSQRLAGASTRARQAHTRAAKVDTSSLDTLNTWFDVDCGVREAKISVQECTDESTRTQVLGCVATSDIEVDQVRHRSAFMGKFIMCIIRFMLDRLQAIITVSACHTCSVLTCVYIRHPCPSPPAPTAGGVRASPRRSNHCCRCIQSSSHRWSRLRPQRNRRPRLVAHGRAHLALQHIRSTHPSPTGEASICTYTAATRVP